MLAAGTKPTSMLLDLIALNSAASEVNARPVVHTVRVTMFRAQIVTVVWLRQWGSSVLEIEPQAETAFGFVAAVLRFVAAPSAEAFVAVWLFAFARAFAFACDGMPEISGATRGVAAGAGVEEACALASFGAVN